MLKETIDRMRYDMDEMRSNAANAALGGLSGSNSAANSVSKSLGAELLGKMKGRWGMEEEEEDAMEDEDSGELDAGPDGDSTEGEDVIQTIITRKKRVRELILVGPDDFDLTLLVEGRQSREPDRHEEL